MGYIYENLPILVRVGHLNNCSSISGLLLPGTWVPIHLYLRVLRFDNHYQIYLSHLPNERLEVNPAYIFFLLFSSIVILIFIFQVHIQWIRIDTCQSEWLAVMVGSVGFHPQYPQSRGTMGSPHCYNLWLFVELNIHDFWINKGMLWKIVEGHPKAA